MSVGAQFHTVLSQRDLFEDTGLISLQNTREFTVDKDPESLMGGVLNPKGSGQFLGNPGSGAPRV